jgi:hypothetical protein
MSIVHVMVQSLIPSSHLEMCFTLIEVKNLKSRLHITYVCCHLSLIEKCHRHRRKGFKCL